MHDQIRYIRERGLKLVFIFEILETGAKAGVKLITGSWPGAGAT
jgi:hypothetical protein